MKLTWIIPFLLLVACATKEIADYEANNVSVEEQEEDSLLVSLIEPYQEGMEAQMNEVIGYASVNFEKMDPESNLGNFSADVVYEAGKQYAQRTKDIGINAMNKSMCLLNFGGLRSSINEGNISIGDIYSLMPFDNTLTLVKLSGEQMKALAIYLFEVHGQPVSNATFQLSSNQQNVSIGGVPYAFDEDVIVVTSDYLANGGDKMTFFNDPIRKWDSGMLIRDVFLDYVKANDTIVDFPVEGRITFVK